MSKASRKVPNPNAPMKKPARDRMSVMWLVPRRSTATAAVVVPSSRSPATTRLSKSSNVTTPRCTSSDALRCTIGSSVASPATPPISLPRPGAGAAAALDT